MCAVTAVTKRECKASPLLDYVEFLQQHEEIQRTNEEICRQNKNLVEEYLDESSCSEKELKKRVEQRRVKREHRLWVRCTLQISSLIILSLLVGYLSYGHLVFVCLIISATLWLYTLTPSFWEKRSKFYTIQQFPTKFRWAIQIIGLLYRVLYLPVLVGCILYNC